MFLNKNPSDKFKINGSKAFIKLSKLFSDFRNQELSSIEESDIPPSSIMFKELSKQILEENLLNKIKTKGIAPKIKHPKEERNIKLMLDIIKKYKGYEQFISLHKNISAHYISTNMHEFLMKLKIAGLSFLYYTLSS